MFGVDASSGQCSANDSTTPPRTFFSYLIYILGAQLPSRPIRSLASVICADPAIKDKMHIEEVTFIDYYHFESWLMHLFCSFAAGTPYIVKESRTSCLAASNQSPRRIQLLDTPYTTFQSMTMHDILIRVTCQNSHCRIPPVRRPCPCYARSFSNCNRRHFVLYVFFNYGVFVFRLSRNSLFPW